MTDPENTPAPPPIKYASFNARMIASMIDVFIIMTFAVPAVNWLMDRMFLPLDMDGFWTILNRPEIMQVPGRLLPELWRLTKEQRIIERAIIENLLQAIFVAAYIIPFWFRFASTPGKMLFRMEIQDAATGIRMSRKQAIIRYFGYIISLIPFSLGFLWIIFNKKCQSWHDMLANTVVAVRPKQKK